MKRLLLLLLFLMVSALAGAQTTTPYLNFNIPSQGTQNWGTLINANFTQIDLYLSGNATLPYNLVVAGNFTVLGACNGCGNGTLTGSGANTQVAVFNSGTNLISYTGFTTDSSGNVSVKSLQVTGSGGTVFTVTEQLTAALPACSGTKYFAFVSDSNSSTYGSTFSGSGSTHTPVYCNGTSWTVH